MASFRKLYHWALQQAEKPYAAWLLFSLAFIEPWLFPLPPDTLLIPMCLARKVNAFRLATMATAGSVAGALVGYGVGALAMATLGQWVISTYHLENAFDHFHHAFNRYGALIILAKGLTPIPFILVTIASGVDASEYLRVRCFVRDYARRALLSGSDLASPLRRSHPRPSRAPFNMDRAGRAGHRRRWLLVRAALAIVSAYCCWRKPAASSSAS